MENDQLKDLEEILLDTLRLIEKSNSSNSSESAVGACLWTPPSGRVQCFQVTPEYCATIKGAFVGGSCPTSDTEKGIVRSDLPDSPIIETPEDLGKTCTLDGYSYKLGDYKCILLKLHVCGKDGWVNLGQNCT